MDSKYKQDVSNSVNLLLKCLDSIDDLSFSNVKDKQLIESLKSIKNVILNGVSNIKSNLEILLNIAEWNQLNVSFFGETNAGKSTIIESLINGDGRSIGEGYKDFTKSVTKISHNNINLLDMPGIEGRECIVIESIHTAIDKSHIVFYVVGTNKEPEEYTISKIKKFLNDKVRVYTIINARGKPSVYKYKKYLKDKNIFSVENRIKNKFFRILGENYSGNIIVNGYLALLKNENIKSTRFEIDQIKALNIFGSKEKIKKFSNIQEIYTLLDSFEKNISNEIIISNTYKFLENIEYVLSTILREKKNFDSFLKEVNELTDKYLNEVNNVINKFESEIMSSLDVNVNSMRVELKKTVNKGIDDGDSENEIKTKLKNTKDKQAKKLNKNIKNLLSSMKEEIEEKMEEFKNRISLQMQFLDIKGEFDFESILESLKINFKYVLGQVIDIGLSIWGVVLAFGINPILGVVAGVLALTRKIWDWFFGDPDKRKRQAKNKAISIINSMTNEIKEKIRKDIEREFAILHKNTKIPVLQFLESMKELKKIRIAIDNKISQVKKSQVTISLLLMKKILGDCVLFSYLDLQLSQAVIIGYEVNKNVENHLLKIFRLKKLKLYSSYHHWLNEAGIYVKNESFIANDEFSYRAANALLLNEDRVFKFIKVARRRSL